jgi:hypothetical protein
MAYSDIKDPSAHFQIALHSSANAANITNDGNSDLQPDLIWSKARGAGHSHGLYDSTRGVTKFLISNTTNTEGTASAGFDLTSFNTDGFSTGNNQFNTICGNTTYVAWQWKANGGTTASNTDGDITSTVQVNQDAGFSIVTYTGNGSTADQTVGHGLGVRANAVLVKNRDAAVNWVVYVDGLTVNHCVELNTPDGESDSTQGRVLSSSAGSYGTSSIFTLRNGSSSVIQTNTSGEDYVAYCFAEKQGYSRFSSYVGNGSSDGPFVYTGFKPRFLMIKSTTATGSHVIWDSKRSPFNGMDDYLVAAEADAEGTNGIFTIDAVSNGFKIRNTGANNGLNQSGTKYVYYAFAEHPFVAGGIPTTAR